MALTKFFNEMTADDGSVRAHYASYAAWLFSEGYTIAEVMLLLGWSDSRMALEVYSRVFPRRVESVGPKQDEALKGLTVVVA
jgi:hypothetical protein